MSSFWLILKQQWTIKISSPLFSIFSLATSLVGSRDHRTQFWKGAIQGPFHQSLVQIGPVASEKLIKMWKVNGRTDDRWPVVTIAHLTLWVRWAKKNQFVYINYRCTWTCISWWKKNHFSIIKFWSPKSFLK